MISEAEAARLAAEFEAELERIATAGVGEFIDEAVHDPREDAAAGRAPRPHGPTRVEHGLIRLVIGDPTTREFIAAEGAAAAWTAAFAEGEAVILPSDDFTLGVDAALEEVDTAGAILIVAHIVFARPRELHGRVDLLGDGGGLDEVVSADATAEAAACAVEMEFDFFGRDAEDTVNHPRADRGDLGGRPDLHNPVVPMRRGVLRLKVGVRDERVAVLGFDGFCGARERRIGIAVFAEGFSAGLGRFFFGLLEKRLPALVHDRALIPGNFELLAGAEGGPGGVGNNRDPWHELLHLAVAFEDERISDAGEGLDFVEVGTDDLATKRRAFFVDGVKHAGQFHIDAEERFAGDDLGRIELGDTRTEEGEIFRLFERDGVLGGHGKGGGLGDKLPVFEGLPGGVNDRGLFGAALGGRNTPRLGGGLDQHGTDSGAEDVKIIVVARCGLAATGTLAAVFLFVEIALFDRDVFPGHLELLGDDHRQRGLYALAHFGLLGDDRDGAGARDAHEGVR